LFVWRQRVTNPPVPPRFLAGSWCAGRVAVQCTILILYRGAELKIDKSQHFVRVVEQFAGVDLAVTRVRTYHADEPTKMRAHSLVQRLEDEERRDRSHERVRR
jgi:hypothetical protein